MKPWNMPSTSASPFGQDFGQSDMVLGVIHWQATSRIPYQFAVWEDNFSGTTACPAGIAASANLVALC